MAKIDIHDPALYARYEEGFLVILDKYKGRILSVDEKPLVLEAIGLELELLFSVFATRKKR